MLLMEIQPLLNMTSMIEYQRFFLIRRSELGPISLKHIFMPSLKYLERFKSPFAFVSILKI